MKILHVITSLGTGGAETLLYRLLERMDRSRFAQEVVSLTSLGDFGEKIRALNIPVMALGIHPGRPNPLALRKLIRKIRAWKPDGVQGWMYHGNLAAQLASRLANSNAPVLWNIRHSVYDLNYEKKMTALMIRIGSRCSHRPRKILYNSGVCADQHERIGFDPQRRQVIPNGFDADLFAPSSEARRSVRNALSIPIDAPVAGMAARFHPMKDHRNFIQAAGLVSKSIPTAHFLLVGKEVDPHNKELMGWIEDAQLQHRVRLLGPRQDLPQLLASLDLYISPSYGEGFPNVVGEAMACGVPCVVTDVGESRNIVGETGKVVPPKDPEQLARAAQSLLELPEAELKALGNRARQRIMDNYSIQSIVQQYETLYETL